MMEKEVFLKRATKYLAEWDPAFIVSATSEAEYEGEAREIYEELKKKKMFVVEDVAETTWNILKKNFEGCLYGVTETELMFGYSPDRSEFSCKCLRFAKKVFEDS